MQSASVYPLLIDHNTRHRFGGALFIKGRKFHIYIIMTLEGKILDDEDLKLKEVP